MLDIMKTRSLRLDIEIMFATVKAICDREGAK